MRLSAMMLLTILAACKPTERPPAGDEMPTTAQPDSTGTEMPIWVFGEDSKRTDAIPTGLDTLTEWYGYEDGERPLAFAIDLNADGSTEWLLRSRSELCGRQGCPTSLLTRKADGKLVDLLRDLVRAVYVTNKRVNGWPVLWLSTGGVDGGVFRFEFRDDTYHYTHTVLKSRFEHEMTSEQKAERDSIYRLLEAADYR